MVTSNVNKQESTEIGQKSTMCIWTATFYGSVQCNDQYCGGGDDDNDDYDDDDDDDDDDDGDDADW